MGPHDQETLEVSVAEPVLRLRHGRGGELLGVAEFEAVKRFIGPELEPLAVYPKRWLGWTFPAEWQLEQTGLVPWSQRRA